MKRMFAFLIRLYKEVLDDDLVSLANELTYKLMLSIFPFLIFLMTLLGFLNIDREVFVEYINRLSGTVPSQIMNMLDVFIQEVVFSKKLELLSTSLIVSIYSSSSGFKAVIKGINKSYGLRDTRNIFFRILLSIGLSFVFAVTIIFSIVVLIFGDWIVGWLRELIYLPGFDVLHHWTSVLATLLILLTAVVMIYKFSCTGKLKLREVLPGAIVTVVLWLLASKVLNVYVNNFSNYSVVYGSIGSIFIMLLWLNVISFILLLGSEINSMLGSNKTINKPDPKQPL